jgi:hypothetical protein
MKLNEILLERDLEDHSIQVKFLKPVYHVTHEDVHEANKAGEAFADNLANFIPEDFGHLYGPQATKFEAPVRRGGVGDAAKNYIWMAAGMTRTLAVSNYDWLCLEDTENHMPWHITELLHMEEVGTIKVTGDIAAIVTDTLTHEDFIKGDPEEYEQFVKQYFKSNQVMMNKWLRYGRSIRDL